MEIPNEIWGAIPKDATWLGALDAPADDGPECPGHGPGTEDESDFCDGSCVTVRLVGVETEVGLIFSPSETVYTRRFFYSPSHPEMEAEG